MGSYYKTLTAAQRNELGAPASQQFIGIDGVTRQIFQGGLIVVQKDGTQSLVKNGSSFTIGYGRDKVFDSFIEQYDRANGWFELGKPKGDVYITSSNYFGTPVEAQVQEFEFGRLYVSARYGTHIVRGVIKDFTGIPVNNVGIATSDAVYTSFGLVQEFESGTVVYDSRILGVTHKIQGVVGNNDTVRNYYLGLSVADRNLLGAPVSEAIYGGNGLTYQFFSGGFIKQTFSNGQISFAREFSSFTVGSDGSRINDSMTQAYASLAGSLGKPTSITSRINDGVYQDFEFGRLYVSPTAGTHIVSIAIRDYIKSASYNPALPTSDTVVNSIGTIQEFEHATIIHDSNGSGNTYEIRGAVGNNDSGLRNYYLGLSINERNILGALTVEVVEDARGGLVQSFKGGTISSQYIIGVGNSFRVSFSNQPIVQLPNNAWITEYYGNSNLQGNPVFTRQETSINYDWGLGGPGSGVGNDNFSVRWQGDFYFDGGNYVFRNTVDDGMLISVDEQVIHDTWNGRNAVDFTQNIFLSQGWHKVKVEYREIGGAAIAKLAWENIKPDIDIQLTFVDNNFTDRQREIIKKAENIWESIIENDKDRSGLLKIAVAFSQTNVDNAYFESNILANAFIDNTIGYRYNISTRFDNTNSIDFDSAISFNINRSWNDDLLLRVALHEIGHTLGLEHDTQNGDDIMSAIIPNSPNTYISDTSYQDLANLGYRFNRNWRYSA